MERKLNVCAFIFARGGSKGVPRKNIKSLGEKPLIAHSIELAKKCPLISKVIVSTDDLEIAKVAQEYGAEVPFIRPQELAGDTSPEWLAWQHAVKEVSKNYSFDYFISLPATSPFRSIEDVENSLKVIQEKGVDFVLSASKAERNPWFNMVKINDQGFAEIVNKSSDKVFRRQDAPVVWDITTVLYVTTPEFILSKSGIFEGNVKIVEVPKERALDIDTPYDFLLAEFLYESQRKSKQDYENN